MCKSIFLSLIVLTTLITGCAGKQTYRASCASEMDSAWRELDVANVKGFSGSVSYSKAVGLISLGRTMQTVENFDNCIKHARDARYYISQSLQGQ